MPKTIHLHHRDFLGQVDQEMNHPERLCVASVYHGSTRPNNDLRPTPLLTCLPRYAEITGLGVESKLMLEEVDACEFIEEFGGAG